MKRTLLILPFLCATLVMYAQTNMPDLQTADNAFFDPTHMDKQEKESYHFAVNYRLEIGYVQNNQRTPNLSFPNMFLHGVRVGGTFDFILPAHFSLQTGLLFNVAYGTNEQHSRSMDAASSMEEYQQHRVLEWTAIVPIHCYYTIPLWKQLNLFFFTGLDMSIGLIEHDFIHNNLSPRVQEEWIEKNGYHLDEYDRYTANELHRFNAQWVLGGGFEWDKYRLQAGYDFGLNNLVKSPILSEQKMNEWSWFVAFAIRL